MSILNKALNFWSKSANLGKPKGCPITLENINSFIIVFDGFKIPSTALTNFNDTLEYLQEQSLNADPEKRLYYVSMLNDFTDSTPKGEKKISGMGQFVTVSEQPHIFDLEIENNGIEFIKRLRRFNLRNDICVYPITNEFIGGKLEVSGDLSPIKAKFYTNIPTLGKITADPTKYSAVVGFNNAKVLTERLDAVAIPNGIILSYELNAITDVTVIANDNVDSIEIEIYETISNRNFILNYYSQLKENNCIFVDGIAKKIDTISNGKGYINNIIAGTHTVKLVSPYALAQFNIGSMNKGGYEGNETTVEVTLGVADGGDSETITWDLVLDGGTALTTTFEQTINGGNA